MSNFRLMNVFYFGFNVFVAGEYMYYPSSSKRNEPQKTTPNPQ